MFTKSAECVNFESVVPICYDCLTKIASSTFSFAVARLTFFLPFSAGGRRGSKMAAYHCRLFSACQRYGTTHRAPLVFAERQMTVTDTMTHTVIDTHIHTHTHHDNSMYGRTNYIFLRPTNRTLIGIAANIFIYFFY